MKTLIVALAAVFLFTGCADYGAITYTRQVGDGKAYVSVANGGYSLGYRGTFASKPIPGSGKQVLPPKVSPATTAEPAAPTKPAFTLPSWLAWANVFRK